MSGWPDTLRRWFRRGRVWLFYDRPLVASPADWDASEVSSNLGVFALSEAEMAERKITATTIGELELPTGKIVACDPLITGLGRPAFSRKVKPGRYPVMLLQAQGRIAAAVLRFGTGLPVSWELATFARDRPPVYESEFLEFIVDDAVASFMDKSLLTLMTDQEELDDYLADVAWSLDRFGMDSPMEGNPLNVAMFDTGFGDGGYKSFWGLDATGEPLVLMTDFEVLENADGREGDRAS
ncbi:MULTISPECIES: DUF4241 domain-containing protein [unclassified Mesorhizobium]|uniref:DUF4241 domain-containing protein n=1 Tax=unclassified Mesorhizobium TaxID=325217 RepID=UPI001126CC8D|nr:MULTISPECIES: DUF4241 domain-containing protein [unclassified Mesorhizobium]TPN47845.1 DUF4241 domain-containing protein [Mesorhizobium sp. B1-1-9]TPN52106.1 DUF4241 domain-containing protein [Mesorhizobium sp. B1-1-7]